MQSKAPTGTATPSQGFQNAPQTPAGTPAAPGVAMVPFGASGAVAMPADLAAEMAKYAKDEAAAERPSVSKIGLRGGMMSYGGQPIQGNVLPCTILVAAHRNAYYDQPFDPNNLQNPVCFALSEDGEDMEAHENVPDDNVPGDDPDKPRDETMPRGCTGCAMNAWGSDPKANSRGKACKETRRLVVIPASALSSAENCLKGELAVLDIPVTSGANYRNFVNGVAASANVPPWIVMTHVSTERHPKNQFMVTFTPMSVVADPAVIDALRKKKDEALRLALLPYDEVQSTGGKMAAGAGVAEKAKPTKTKF